jgi:hypothetical protein
MKNWPYRTEVKTEETMGTNRPDVGAPLAVPDNTRDAGALLAAPDNRRDVGALLAAPHGRGQKGATGLMKKYPDKLLKTGEAKTMTNNPDKFLKTKGRSMNPKPTIQMSQ